MYSYINYKACSFLDMIFSTTYSKTENNVISFFMVSTVDEV